MLNESCDIVGEENVGGGKDKDSKAVGESNAATDGVAGATSCVPNNWTYGRLETYLSGGMAPTYP